MEKVYKKPYEISIWEDILVKPINGIIDDLPGTYQYYREQKIAVIGSDTMTSPIRAQEPSLQINVNGEVTLTFKLYAKYFSEETNQLENNPFIKLITNERKIKIRHEDRWYDMVIKEVNEASLEEGYTYTAKSAHINELSKNGFNIELDIELENNMGTISELAQKVLDGSGWKVGSFPTIQEKSEEALYEVITTREMKYKILDSFDEKLPEYTLPAFSRIYVYYSTIAKRDPMFYFCYRYQNDNAYEKDENRIITNGYTCVIENVSYNEEGLFTDFINSTYAALPVSEEYRAKRLVKKQKITLDARLNQMVSVHKKVGIAEDIYCFKESNYLTSSSLGNYVTNGSFLGDSLSWIKEGPASMILSYNYGSELNVPGSVPGLIEGKPYMKINIPSGSRIKNEGIQSNAALIESFVAGEEYVFRIKHQTMSGAVPSNVSSAGGIGAKVIYTNTNNIEETIFDFTGTRTVEEKTDEKGIKYQHIRAVCKKSLTFKELKSGKVALYLYNKSVGDFYVSDVQLFPYIVYNNAILLPEATGTVGDDSPRTKYYYYSSMHTATSPEEIEYLYAGYDPNLDVFQPVYSNNCEKIRSVTAAESNRFNIIQDLCETFECWASFDIDHLPNGEIEMEYVLDSYGKRIAKIPKKTINFKEYVGKENHAGFKYGVNLNSVKRTLDSNEITTKMIVKNNNNEYANSGFCSIARAQENPIGANFLLNFDYYIQQGYLDFAELNKDMYSTEDGYIGYYKRLGELNRRMQFYGTNLSTVRGALTKALATETQYEVEKTAAEEEVGKLEEEYGAITDSEYAGILSDSYVQAKKVAITQLKARIAELTILLARAKTNREDLEAKVAEINSVINIDLKSVRELDYRFYQKYYQYIQEGSWMSEDYIDDNLYYLDAQSVLYTSRAPVVSYDINVMEVSTLEGYENYTFAPGDITFIEDTEFFGYYFSKNGVKTPYKEEIVVSEVTYNLDRPEENQIRVQNYKTQFDDLFQRIAAVSQSVEYKTGAFIRATNALTPDGTVTSNALQEALKDNELIISNSSNNSVVWGPEGISITNLVNPNEVVRLVGGGIAMSQDGGVSWKTGITGRGMNANYITAGQVDASVINIVGDTRLPSFRWDKLGINAYDYTASNVSGFNGSFVRFDKFGIYGMAGTATFTPQKIEDVLANANFGLTWKGFFMKGRVGSYEVDLSTSGGLTIKNGTTPVFQTTTSGAIIGGFTIGSSSLYKGTTSMISSTTGVYLGTDGINLGGGKFKVTSAGALTATGVNISGAINASSGSFTGTINATSGSFTGKITASSGSIGGFTIGSSSLCSGTTSMTSTSAGVYLGTNGINLGGKFKVTSTGALTATSGIFGIFSIGTYTNPSESETGEESPYFTSIAGVTNGEAILGTNVCIANSGMFFNKTATSNPIGGTYQVGTNRLTPFGLYLTRSWRTSSGTLSLKAQFSDNGTPYARIAASTPSLYIASTNAVRINAEYLVPYDAKRPALGTSSSPWMKSTIDTLYISTLQGGREGKDQIRCGNTVAPLSNNAYNLGSSSLRWGTVCLQNEPQVASDEKIKRSISPIENAIELIENLKPVQFKFNDGKRLHYGVIAQQLKEAMTEANIEDCGAFIRDTGNEIPYNDDISEEDTFYAVRYGELIAPLMTYTKDLKRRLLELEAEVENLKKQGNSSIL